MSILALTLAGSVATAAVLLLDRAFSHTVEARSRQWWWFAIPLAFILLPIELPLLPSLHQSPTPFAEGPVFSFAEALGLPKTSLSHFTESPSLPLMLWGAGVAASLLYFSIATFRTSRRWKRERLSTDARLLALLEDCRAVAAISAPIGVIVSSQVSSPALLGWLRPRLLLSKVIADEAPDEQLRAIILHELAHFKTTDIAARWPFLLASALHWFNPIAHLASWRWMQIQEKLPTNAPCNGCGKALSPATKLPINFTSKPC